jgi:hypothetical protein
MSSPNSTENQGGLFRKPRADIFTVLLVVALLAIIVGIVALYAYMRDYDMKFKGGPSAANSAPAVGAPAMAQASPSLRC